MKVINGYVFVLPDPTTENKTESGLILPESKAVVIANGTIQDCASQYFVGEELYDTPFKVGDRVMYSPSMGTPWGKLLIFRVTEILAVLD